MVETSELTVRPIKPLIGAEVFAPKEALLNGRHAAMLRELLEDRGVLVFRDAALSAEEHVRFTETLGRYVPDKPDGSPTYISIDPAIGRSSQYTQASFFWHFDGYMNDIPILATILTCETAAAEGGRTEFCNTYAAWEALSVDCKAALNGLRAIHALAGAQLSVDPEPSYDTFREWREVRHSTLPLVWTHKSGRKSLVIGNTAVGVVDVDPLESLELLVFLRDWATQERFSYSHQWAPGDVVLWDNTGTLHRATPYAADSGRRMRRTKLGGEEAWGS